MTANEFPAVFPELLTDRLRLRQIREDDAEALCAYYADEQVTKYLDWNGPSTPEEAAKLIRGWNDKYAERSLLPWGICLRTDPTLIGTVMLMPIRGTFEDYPLYPVNIGFELARPYWKRGLITEAVQAAVNYGKKTFGVGRFQAEVLPENAASVALLEKVGFRQEGVLRRYLPHSVTHVPLDIIMLSLI